MCLGRLGSRMMDRLVTTSTPIGQLLREHRLETFREVLASGKEQVGECARYFDAEPLALLAFRTYRSLAGGRPVIMITENFPVVGALNGLP